jgi:pseudouridine-5'-phosphate glycosidase
MALAHLAGIRVFATGGIGGAHPPEGGVGNADCGIASASSHSAFPVPHLDWDVSADLTELARTPVAVVCAGAKSILDLRRTLELLETLSVPVVGYGCADFPAFYLTTSGHPVSCRVETAEEAAALLTAHWQLGGRGVVLAQPLPAEAALDPAELQHALAAAERDAVAANVRGPARTPFLLARLADRTGGRTLRANQALVVANARLAALIAALLPQEQ